MENFCNNLVKYFDKKSIDNDQLICYILKDIYQNDLIYIKEQDTWKEYRRSKWIKFDLNFKLKIQKAYKVLEKVIQEVVNLDIDDNKKRLFLRKIFTLSKHILQYKYNNEDIHRHCKLLFEV